jgi:crotonobetainyl-CoA:carnitine CoA-transferase CaiB-like acyl-CoA transferase
MADTVTSVFAALGIMAALREREASPDGNGQVVDLGLYEALFRLVDSQVIGYDQLGIIKEPLGNRMAEDAPRNAYETSDGRWIAVSASSNRTWQRLADAIGQPELAADPRFDSSSGRVENVDELDAILAAWFGSHTSEEALNILSPADVTAGPVMNIADIFADPQYIARENIVEVPDPDFGSVRMQGVVPRFSRTPGTIRHPGLTPGAHNGEVYSSLLGLDLDDLERLSGAGII